jgi:hypothetical protein
MTTHAVQEQFRGQHACGVYHEGPVASCAKVEDAFAVTCGSRGLAMDIVCSFGGCEDKTGVLDAIPL